MEVMLPTSKFRGKYCMRISKMLVSGVDIYGINLHYERLLHIFHHSSV